MRRVAAFPTWALVAALVAVSSGLRAWAGLTVATPWIAPDELIYADLGRALWQTGHLTLVGQPTHFFSFVYPALAGLPLSLGDRQLGYDLLKLMQAGVMSLTAMPVYLWGRELASRGWALVAAVLALAPPGLAYSGLVMTEVAFYPGFVVAAWAIARAIADPTPRRQVLALAAIAAVFLVRLQALVLAPAYLTAVLLDAACARSPRRALRHLPAVGGMLVLAAVWSGWQLRHGGPLTEVLGGYRAAGETTYSVGAAARFVLYHLGDVVLVSGVVPFCAVLVLAVRAAVPGEEDANARAFLATTVALTVWVVAEVGIFASRHVGHLAERNLFPLVALFALGLVVWLRRGAPRPLVAGTTAAALAVLLLVALPLETLTSLAATPSSFTQIPLLNVTSHVDLDVAVPVVAAALLALCAVLPRRVLAAGLPVLLVALGAAASVSASRFVASESRYVERLTLGGHKQWIHVHGSVAYLDAGYLNWETVWENRFWTPNVDRVYGLFGTQSGGIPTTSVGPFEDGRLVFADGSQVSAGYVLAAAPFQLAGRQLATNGAGLVLWQVEPPVRLVRWTQGVGPDGSVADGRATLNAYACTGGSLTGTIAATTEVNVQILRNDVSYAVFAVQPGEPHPIEVPVSVLAPAGQHACTITVQADGPFSLTNLGFG